MKTTFRAAGFFAALLACGQAHSDQNAIQIYVGTGLVSASNPIPITAGSSPVAENLTQINGITVLTAGVNGTLVVGGNQAAGGNVSSNSFPILQAGSDYGGTPIINLTKVDSSGNQFVQVTAALPTGANTIGAVTQASGPWTQNLTQIGTTTVVTGGVAGLLGVGGPVASGAANARNPVKIGGVFNTTQPTVTNAQIVDAQATARGALIVGTGVDVFNVTVNAALPAGGNTIGGVTLSNLETNLTAGAAPSKMTVIGGQFNSAAPAPTNGQTVALQTDSSGNLKTNIGINAAGTSVDGFTTGNSGYPVLGLNHTFNGTTWDRLRGNVDTGVLQTLSAQGAGTLNSADQTNYNGTAVSCVFDQTVTGGTPSTTFSIQFKDTTSGKYVSVITSAAIVGNSTNMISAGANANTANVSDNRKLVRTWRTQAVVTGTSPAVTATVGCSVSGS